MAFSLKFPGPERKDITLHNDMVGVHTQIKVFEKFDDGLKHFKKYFSALKSSFKPFGVVFLS